MRWCTAGTVWYVCGRRPSRLEQHSLGTAVHPASTAPASWDAFTDVDACVDEVLSELAAMAADGTRPTRGGPKPALTGAALRKAILALWCVCFCGMLYRHKFMRQLDPGSACVAGVGLEF
jgi:hypothetical protein